MKRHLLTKTILLASSLTAAAITYSEWKQLRFTPAQQYDLGVSGQAADPDSDGRSNLLEYAFDTDPLLQDQSALFATSLDAEGHLTLDFPMWKSHAGIIYIPQITGNLIAGWQAGAAYIENLSVTDLDADHSFVSVRDPLSTAQAHRWACPGLMVTFWRGVVG
jgi:hypothetical protein